MVVVLVNLPVPEEGIRYSEPNTRAIYKDNTMGKGTLHITESCVCWTNSDGQGFSLTYTSINVHAICKDTSSFPDPCLYLMLEESLDENNENDNEDGEDENFSEIRFVPDNVDSLEFLYKAMCDCQALHSEEPEHDSDNEGGEGDDGVYDDAEEDDETYQNGDHREGDPAGGDAPPSTGQEVSFDPVDDDEPMEVGQFEDA